MNHNMTMTTTTTNNNNNNNNNNNDDDDDNNNNNPIIKSNSTDKTGHEKVGGDNDSARAVKGSHSHSHTNNDCSSNNI